MFLHSRLSPQNLDMNVSKSPLASGKIPKNHLLISYSTVTSIVTVTLDLLRSYWHITINAGSTYSFSFHFSPYKVCSKSQLTDDKKDTMEAGGFVLERKTQNFKYTCGLF